MKIFISIKAGLLRSLKSWNGILIICLCSLLLVSLVAIPLKGALKSGFGNSMITEMLKNGINVEVFADLGATFRSIFSSFSSGLFMSLLVGFLINSFLSGGLFNSLKGLSEKFSAAEFFKASARNFWSFFIITFIISVIIILLIIILIAIPVTIVSQNEIASEGAAFRTGIIATSIFLLFLPILLLVADYARAWQVLHEKDAGFKAVGFGFSRTFRTFISSYCLMLILMIIQALYGWLVLSIIAGMKPVTGGGVFLLFILSQLLFFIKILLKGWRYGSVTRLMEINSVILTPASPDQKARGSLPHPG
jgi:hypothetical protein